MAMSDPSKTITIITIITLSVFGWKHVGETVTWIIGQGVNKDGSFLVHKHICVQLHSYQVMSSGSHRNKLFQREYIGITFKPMFIICENYTVLV